MQAQSPEAESRQVRLLSRLFLVAILGASGAGLVLGYVIDVNTSRDTAWLLIGALAVVAVSEYFLIVGMLLPRVAAQPTSRPATTASLGFAFADAVAIYGCAGAIFSGIGLIAVPFGVLALFLWQSVHSFLADTYRDILG